MKNNIFLLFSLSRAETVISRRLSGHGLSFSDYIILHHLSNAPEKKLRRIDLAHKMGLTASGITRMLLPLEKLGIVSRDLSQDDARARYATITKAGQELFKDATATLEMKLSDVIPQKDASLIAKFTEFLEILTENLLEPEYQQEAKIRWGGSELYRQSAERVRKMSKADIDRIKKEGLELTKSIADKMHLGVSHAEVQKLIAEHYNALRNFYEPNLEMYRGLGEMYVNDPRFGAYYEKFAPGLAQFMCDAMKVYCEKNK